MDHLLQTINIFKNPNKVALNVLSLEYKILRKHSKTLPEQTFDSKNACKNFEIHVEKLPALHKAFIQNASRVFHPYTPFYQEINHSLEDTEQYIKTNEKFLDGLVFLLKCTFHQFWCYITQHPQVSHCLSTFLYKYSPDYEVQVMNNECRELYQEIRACFAQVFVRLMNFEQSDEEFLEEKVALDYLQQKKLLNFSVVCSMCAIFNDCNSLLLKVLLEKYLKVSHGRNECKKMFQHVSFILDIIAGAVLKNDSKIQSLGIPKKPHSFSPQWYLEICKYLLDMFQTIDGFLTHNAQFACEIFYEEGMCQKISNFYHKVYAEIYCQLENRNPNYDWSKLNQEIMRAMALGRAKCISCFHYCVSYFIDQIMKQQGSPNKQEVILENYIQLMSTASEEEFFMADYCNVNEVDMQLLLISEYYPELDTMRTNYILDCLSTLPKLQHMDLNDKKLEATSNLAEKSPEKPMETQKGLSENEIEERIQSVLDALPHLGDGFILQCLQYYNYNPEEIISAVLDENLPPNLAQISQDLIRVPPEPKSPPPLRAFKGKKPDFADAADLLNDKSSLGAVKDFILRKSSEVPSYDMYDDEYDDRDDYVVPSSSRHGHSDDEDPYAYMENRFRAYESPESEEEEKLEPKKPSEKPHGAGSSGFVPFCEDPSKIRERREAQRNRGAIPKANVVGRPKGQGQDASILKQRDKKTQNKSTRANHNRKGGAQFKRSKGMF